MLVNDSTAAMIGLAWSFTRNLRAPSDAVDQAPIITLVSFATGAGGP